MSRLDAIEHQIEPPVESEAIEEQAEQIVAVIEGTATDATAEIVDNVIAKADAAENEAALNAIIKETEQHKPFLADDLQIKLEVAFDRNRHRLAERQTESAK